MKKSVIILAAGLGTRMNSDTPKILHKIAGRSIIYYIINAAISSKAEEIIIVIGENDEILNEAKNIYPNIKYVRQLERLGTAHAAKLGLTKLGKNIDIIQILCGDIPLIEAKTLINLADNLKDNDLSFLGFIANDPTNYGRIIEKNNKILEIIEEIDASDEQRKIKLCNSGVVTAKKFILEEILPLINNNNKKNEYYLTDLVKIAAMKKIDCGIILTGEKEVQGVNNKEDLARAEKLKQNQIRSRVLREGTYLIDPETNYFSDDIIIGKNSKIHPYVIFGEKVVIGENVEILPFSHIIQSEIKDNSIIGPFARIRANNIIEENCKIGNFVELKNSLIKGKNTKISHLSYIGDSNLGANVNIGAGSITCNYNGKRKNQTIIEDNVFIGSNTSLIAPLTIEKNSFVAAGSVITENIPSENLAISRIEQLNLPKKIRKDHI